MNKDHLLWPSAYPQQLQLPKLAHTQLSNLGLMKPVLWLKCIYHDNFHVVFTACIENIDEKYLRETFQCTSFLELRVYTNKPMSFLLSRGNTHLSIED